MSEDKRVIDCITIIDVPDIGEGPFGVAKTDNFARSLWRTKAINDALEAGAKVEVSSNPFLDMMRTDMAAKPKPTMKPGKPKGGKKC